MRLDLGLNLGIVLVTSVIPANALTTEDGQALTTEDGQILTTEG